MPTLFINREGHVGVSPIAIPIIKKGHVGVDVNPMINKKGHVGVSPIDIPIIKKGHVGVDVNPNYKQERSRRCRCQT